MIDFQLVHGNPRKNVHSIFFLERHHKRILRLIKAWDSQGYNSIVISLRGDEPPKPTPIKLNLPVYVLTDEDDSVFKSFRVDVSYKIRSLLQKFNPDLIFSHETLVDYLVKFSLLGMNIPLITLLGIHRWKWEKKSYRVKLFKWLFSQGAAILGNSFYCLEGYRRVIGQELFETIPSGVVLNPVVPEEYKPIYHRQHSKLIIGALGRLHYQNGFDLLLEAFAMMPDSLNGKKIVLHIKGPDYHGDKLKEIIEKKKLVERVKIIKPSNHIQPFLHSLDCLVSPSRFAGFDNVPLESMLTGTYTLASAETGLYQIPTSPSIPFLPMKTRKMKELLIEKLRLSSKRRAVLAKEQRNHIIQHLHYEKIGESLTTFIRENIPRADLRP